MTRRGWISMLSFCRLPIIGCNVKGWKDSAKVITINDVLVKKKKKEKIRGFLKSRKKLLYSLTCNKFNSG